MSLRLYSQKKIRKTKNKWRIDDIDEYIRQEQKLKEELQDLDATTTTGFITILAGSAKGFKILVPKGARPVTSRMKISLFDLLNNDIIGKTVLDLYAGSGSLGIEALSRGAEHATFVDSSIASEQALVQNVQKTGFASRTEVVKSKVIPYLANDLPRDQYFDIIFLDPPYKEIRYKQGTLELLLDLASKHLRGFDKNFKGVFKGVIIFKHPASLDLSKISIPAIRLLETRVYGRNAISFFIVDKNL